MIDVGAVLTRLPDALHRPGKDTALSSPELVAVFRGTALDLSAVRDRVVQDLVGAIIRADGLRVHAPVNMSDETRARTKLPDKLEVLYSIQVDLVVMGANG